MTDTDVERHPGDVAHDAFMSNRTDETAIAWLRAELRYGFMDESIVNKAEGSLPLEDTAYDDIVHKANELMTKRKDKK